MTTPTPTARDVLDAIAHPPHYGGADNPYEAIKVIDAWGLGFALGNAVKYICRAGRKPGAATLDDLRKAAWYINHAVEQAGGAEARPAPACEQCASLRRDFDARGAALDAMIRAYEGKVAEVGRLTRERDEALRLGAAAHTDARDRIVERDAMRDAVLSISAAIGVSLPSVDGEGVADGWRRWSGAVAAECDRLRADLARLTAAGPVSDEEAAAAYNNAPGGLHAGIMAVAALATARTRAESTASLRAAEERAAEAERQRDEWRSAWDTLARTASAPEPGPFDFPAIEWQEDAAGYSHRRPHDARPFDAWASTKASGNGWGWGIRFFGDAPDAASAKAAAEAVHRLVTAPTQPSGATGPATDEELRRVEEDTRRDVAESGRAAGVGAQMIAVHAAPAVRRALYEHGRTAPAPGREERGDEGAAAVSAYDIACLAFPDGNSNANRARVTRALREYVGRRIVADSEECGEASTPPRAERASLGAPAGTGGGRGEAWGRETRRLLFVALMAAFFDGSQVGADPCTRDAAEAALLRHLGITPSPPTHPPVGEGEGRV